MKLSAACLALFMSTCLASAVPIEQIREEQAVSLLSLAVSEFNADHVKAAIDADCKIFDIPGASPHVTAMAFILMGNMAMSQDHLDVAEVAYDKALRTANSPIQDKIVARHGIEAVQRLRQAGVK